jgi:peptidyl-tRNA hydrolase
MEVETPVHNKLYIITHQGLSSGYQTAQSIHAATEFTMNYREHASEWYETSNTVVCLEAESTEELQQLVLTAAEKSIVHAPFYEPDLNNELTAVAFAPGETSRELLAHLPLVGRRKASTAAQKREFSARQARREVQS